MTKVEDFGSNWTPGPWEYVPATENHGPYVACPYGGDICDCYTMSNPTAASVRNGGDSYPVHFQHEMAEANARLIAAAPDMAEALERLLFEDSDISEEQRIKNRVLARAALARTRSNGESND